VNPAAAGETAGQAGYVEGVEARVIFQPKSQACLD